MWFKSLTARFRFRNKLAWFCTIAGGLRRELLENHPVPGISELGKGDIETWKTSILLFGSAKLEQSLSLCMSAEGMSMTTHDDISPGVGQDTRANLSKV